MFIQPPSFSLYNTIVSFGITFSVVLVAAKFGQYLFFTWDTSPALLWPASGIILAILWRYGYSFTVPIFLALCLSSYTSPLGPLFPMVITTPLAQVSAGVVGVYLLRKLGWNDGFNNLRVFFVFLLVITVSSMIIPTITSTVTELFGNPTVPFYYSWVRGWMGYVFSSLLLFPFIVSWLKIEVFSLAQYRKGGIELGILYILLFLSSYILFWQRLENEALFLFLTFFLIAIFWVCFRFPNHVVNFTIVSVTVFSLLGLFTQSSSEVALNVRLIASQLFFLMIIPVAYMFSVLVQSNNQALKILEETNNKVAKESVTKSEFIAVLAHELRNPLSPLRSTLEILEFENMAPDTRVLVSNAKMHVHTMRRLLDDLLDTTRMMQGKFQLQISRSNLCEMLHHCLEYTKSLYIAGQHTIIMAQTCDDTVWLDVDPVRFEQVIVNILNNAAKYMNRGGTVTIDYAVIDRTVSITIADNGVGISAEHLDHIFDSFWQAEKVLPRAGGGIGVGLALTKQIVEMHGGTIVATSAGVGQGTTLIVTFPLSINSGGATYPVPAVVISPTPSLSVLVVDDNQAASDSLAKLLKLKGHAASVTYSGFDAIAMVQHGSFEVVILDIGLPDIDGFAVAKQLLEIGYRGSLVALSGYSQKEYTDKALLSGFDHYMTKPISVKVLENYFRTSPRVTTHT